MTDSTNADAAGPAIARPRIEETYYLAVKYDGNWWRLGMALTEAKMREQIPRRRKEYPGKPMQLMRERTTVTTECIEVLP